MPVAEKVRLLVCHNHESVEEVPWCGEDNNCTHPGCVDPLMFRVNAHGDNCRVSLVDIETAVWNNPANRPELLRRIAARTNPGEGEGIGEPLYALKDTFTEDAAKCWKRHGRTTDCADYRHISKKLVPDTRGERKDLGLETRAKFVPTQTFLCDFCPYKSILQTKMGSDKYKYNLPDNY